MHGGLYAQAGARQHPLTIETVKRHEIGRYNAQINIAVFIGPFASMRAEEQYLLHSNATWFWLLVC
jgi:hypothetical protein